MASTLTVKDMNQEIVRDCMKGLGPVSKSVLSRKTGLSFPTVSKTVDLLCETGEVEEAGTEKSGGGRCAALYRLNPVFSLYLLLTVENDTIHWSLKDLEGNSLKEETSEENFPILTNAVSLSEGDCNRSSGHGFRRESCSHRGRK